MAKRDNRITPFSIDPNSANAQVSLSIFDILKTCEDVTSTGLSEQLDVSPEALTEYTAPLLQKGLIEKTGTAGQERFAISAGRKKYVGIGFTKKEGIITLAGLGGGIEKKELVPIPGISSLRGKVKEFNGIVETLKKGISVSAEDVVYAGLAVPDAFVSLNPRSTDILAEGISDIFKKDVKVTSESTAAGYGERESITEIKGKDVLYIYSDIGSGVAIKGEMIFEANVGGNDTQGRYLRPWNQFSIVNTAKALVNKGVGTTIVNAVNGEIDSIDLEIVLDSADRGDELAEDLVKRSGLALGVRVAYLANMFNIDKVVLGGGIEKKEGDFSRFVRESAGKFLVKGISGNLEIISGILGKEASSVGAAFLGRRESFMEV